MTVRTPHVASAVLSWIRAAGGRSRRMEQELLRQSDQLKRLEMTMSDVVEQLKALHEQITTTMKSKAADIDAAVAKAKAAWEAGNQADHDAAIAELEAIKAELATPPAFTPSGN